MPIKDLPLPRDLTILLRRHTPQRLHMRIIMPIIHTNKRPMLRGPPLPRRVTLPHPFLGHLDHFPLRFLLQLHLEVVDPVHVLFLFYGEIVHSGVELLLEGGDTGQHLLLGLAEMSGCLLELCLVMLLDAFDRVGVVLFDLPHPALLILPLQLLLHFPIEPLTQPIDNLLRLPNHNLYLLLNQQQQLLPMALVHLRSRVDVTVVGGELQLLGLGF